MDNRFAVQFRAFGFKTEGEAKAVFDRILAAFEDTPGSDTAAVDIEMFPINQNGDRADG